MIELRGMTWNHPRGLDPLVAHARKYEKQSGVKIVWDARSLEEFEAFPLDELAEKYDLMVIDHPHVGMAAAAGGCLLPFDPSIHFDTVGRSHETYHFAGQQWALAIDAAAQVSARRAGAMDHWPTDWQEIIAMAKEDRVVCPLAPVHALMTFFTLCANSGHPCATEGDRLIDRGNGAEMLARIREFAALLPESCLEQNPIGILDLMAADARFIYCPLIYGYVSYARDGFRATRIEFGDMPARTGSTLGGTGVAVSARSKHRDIAVTIAIDLASPQTQRGLYVRSGGQPAHRDTWTDTAANDATHDFFINTRATLDASYIRPRFDGYIGFQNNAGWLVVSCLKRELEPTACIDQVNTLFARAQPAT